MDSHSVIIRKFTKGLIHFAWTGKRMMEVSGAKERNKFYIDIS